MNTETILEKIQQQKPNLVYVSGKTCTGKTTFAEHLVAGGYHKVELDKVVQESVVVPFGVAAGDGFRTAYRGLGPQEQTSAFTRLANLEIQNRIKESPVVVEGAVATSQILKGIFSGNLTDFVFIYFHPINPEVYEQRILSRFVGGAKTGSSGLPKYFWELVKDADLEEFKKTDVVNLGIKNAIKEYAKRSMLESKERLESFRVDFPNLAVVEI